MTNYNERLDEMLCKLTTGYTIEELLSLPEEDTGLDEFEVKEELEAVDDAKQAINSLFKELVAEAKPELPALFAGLDDISVVMYKKGTDEFEQNLLKALDEK